MTHLRFNFSGWSDLQTGYGKANLNLMESLDRLTNGGVSVEWERQICGDPRYMDGYSDAQKAIIHKPFTMEKIGIIQSTPNWFKNIHNDYRIGWSMVENNHIGKQWVKFCNQMDHIFVPATQLVEIFQHYKVEKPITVIPEGYDPRVYQYIERPPREVFTFLLVGWLDERKNWEAVVQAFMSEFAPEEPVRLLLKNSCPHFGYNRPTDPRIKVIDHKLSEEELVKLYGLADCFVFPTRGEGFGIPALEAMATGLPTILTNWLGLADLCDSKYNYPIDPMDLKYRYFRPEQQGFMANIDVPELMYLMRHIYQHQNEAKEKGRLAAAWVKDNWTWDHSAQKIIAVVEEISKTLPKDWKDNYEFSNAWLEDVSNNKQPPEFLTQYKDKKIKIIQVGVYEGRWTMWALHNILTHPESTIIDIDPYTTEEDYLLNKTGVPLEVVKNRYFKNLDNCEFKGKITTHLESSHIILPTLEKNSFDLIYIDGSHLAKDVSQDAEDSFLLLKPGGILFFDDYMWNMEEGNKPEDRPHEAINEFLIKHHGEWEFVHRGYQLAIKKL